MSDRGLRQRINAILGRRLQRSSDPGAAEAAPNDSAEIEWQCVVEVYGVPDDAGSWSVEGREPAAGPADADSREEAAAAQLRQLWREHTSAPFPDACRGQEVAGIELVLLDADIAGLVTKTLDRSAPLGVDDATDLRQLVATEERVIPALEGSDRAYFERLFDLARLVLERHRG